MQASVRHLRLSAAHFHPGFRSSLDPAELTSLEKARNTFGFITAIHILPPPGSPLPALHSPASFPSSSPAGCTCPDRTASHPQSARPSRSVPLKTKFILCFVCDPFVPCLLTHGEPCEDELCSPYHSRMLRPQRLHTGRSRLLLSSISQDRQTKYRHSFVLSSPLNYNYLQIPRDSRKLGFIWHLQ